MAYGFSVRFLLCGNPVHGSVTANSVNCSAFFPSPDQAVKALNQYKGYIDKSGEKWETHKDFGDNSFTAQEPYHKTILVVQQGSFVVGIADLSQVKKGEALLKKILASIRRQESVGKNKCLK